MNLFPSGRTLSRGRRIARVVVWVVFAVVAAVYYRFPPEPSPSPASGRGPGRIANRGVEGRDWDRRRFRRRPTRMHPPAGTVPNDLWRLKIEIGSNDVEVLRGYRWNGWHGAPQERPQVRATVREGSNVYTNVTLHLKGAAGSFRPFDDKPAMTLNFKKHARGQRFHGYTKISLNNSVQDRSYLSEAVSRELFEAAGVPVTRASHATVLVNGRDLGLFVVTEGWEKPFLRRHFDDVGGNLYDGGFLQDINTPLDTNSGDNRSDRSDLERLAAAAYEPDAGRRWERLHAVLDVDRFLSFLAMEIMTCHWDGYGMNKNNYRVFNDNSTGRMVFMPHGLDQMFGVGRSNPTSSIEPDMKGLVARAVVSTTDGYDALIQRIDALRSSVFRHEEITNRIAEISARIRPTLAAYAPDLAVEHDYHAADFQERVVARARSITEQLRAIRDRQFVTFDGDEAARLEDWTSYVRPRDRDRLQLDEVVLEGRNVLRAAATAPETDGGGGGGGGALWWTRVWLRAGTYRLEGEVRSRGLNPGDMVAFRGAGFVGEPLLGDVDTWTGMAVDLEIRSPVARIDLACEVRITGGEVWLDRESLRLIRLDD